MYDQFGNLTFVIPPLVNATTTISNTILNDLCYQYKYDSRNRLVEKKLPGKQWEYIVYDKLDRVVATGPTFPPFSDLVKSGWMITKYDVYNRPILTGWMSSAATINSALRKTRQDERDAQTANLSESRTDSTPDVTISGITYRYSNVAIPTSGYHVLTVNYYDDYNYPNAPTIPTSIEGQNVYYNTTKKPIGLPTGSWIRAIKTSTSYRNETTYVLYDYKARPIRTFIKNHENSPGGYTQVDSKLDFSGKTLYTLTLHKRINSETGITIKDSFTYTDQNRLQTHTQQIGTGAVQLLAENTYDELGQLTSKNIGNTGAVPLQKVDYAYNIRGWLTGINNDPTNNLVLNTNEKDLFAFKINYNTTEGNVTSVKPLYNGNISETYWRTGSDNVLRKYGYEYDNLNRLKNALYQKPGGNTYPTYEDYSEKNITYDKNGNIQTFSRNGDLENALPANQIDDLHYFYKANSNILTSVYDNSGNTSGFKDSNVGDDYTYDANGNMIVDKNKNITEIIYNHLNLPIKITFGTTGTIEYLYDANGKKLEKLVTQGTVATTTKYLEGFQYTNDVLNYFPTAEGYVSKTGSSYKYVFNYTDHLGNIRLSYAKNPTTGFLEILEENNYYPFGLKHKGYNEYNPITNYKYKYNGKELQDELGLNMYDLGARMYMPDIGRFGIIDPMADFVNYQSPYVMADNNPIENVDEFGLGSCWLCRVFNSIFVPKSEQVSSADGRSSGRKSRGTGWDVVKKERKKQTPTPSSTGGEGRTPVVGINLDPIGITKRDNGVEPPEINIPQSRSSSNSSIDRNLLESGHPINIDIAFESFSPKIDFNISNKTLNDLLKTLVEYPHIMLSIKGNARNKLNPNLKKNTKIKIDGVNGTVGELQMQRAEAIKNFLVEKGIDPDRLSTDEGVISKNSRSATIQGQ